jgi:hypothetical protein
MHSVSDGRRPAAVVVWMYFRTWKAFLATSAGSREDCVGTSAGLVLDAKLEALEADFELRDLDFELGDPFGKGMVTGGLVTGSIGCLALGVGHCHLQ